MRLLITLGFGLLSHCSIALLAPSAVRITGHAAVRSGRAAAPLRAAATEEAANPRTFGLALELDDGTRKVHSVAENTQSASV